MTALVVHPLLLPVEFMDDQQVAVLITALFAWLKLGSFWVLQAVSLLLLLGLLGGLIPKLQTRHLAG